MSEGEIVGDVAQGSMLARAAEPAHGEASDGHSHETACLNCGTALVGSHCHACGQAGHVHRTLGAFFHDLLHGVFHFEGKIWRTLPLLIWNPGRLTREYIDGRRASYVSPIALFLFCVFLMFAVVRQFGGEFQAPDAGQVDAGVVAGIAQAEKNLRALEARRAVLVRQNKSSQAIDNEILGQKAALETMRSVKQGNLEIEGLQSDLGWINRAFKAFQANPAFVLYKMQNSAYKYSWALIPISVPFVWLLFAWRRRFGLYDHTVFVTYSLCFMTLLVVLITLGEAAGLSGLTALAVLAPPIHVFRQVRGTYALGARSALWRTIAILNIALAALLLFALLIVAETSV